jgi:hypothetical protein
MTLPAGISTCLVTFGKALDALANQATIKGTVELDRSVVWAATGDGFYTRPAPVESSSGGWLEFAAPHVDQDGFRTPAGTAITDFAYILKAEITFSGTAAYTVEKPFQVKVGQTSIDLDLVPGGTITQPVEAPVARVTSVAGRVNEVTVEDLAEALSAEPTFLEPVVAAVVASPELAASIADRSFLSGNFRLKATRNKISQIEKGVVTQLGWCVTGTSVADMLWNEYASDLMRLAGGYAGAVLHTGTGNSGSPRGAAGIGTVTQAGTITQSSGNDAAVWPGPTTTLGASAVITYGVGGATTTYDHADVLYIGGTGVFSVKVAAGSAVNVDTSTIPAGQLGIYSATVPGRANQAFTVTRVSGSPKLVGVVGGNVGLWDSTVSGVIVYGIRGDGLTYADLTTQAWDNYQAFLAHYKPDMVTWEAKGGQWVEADLTELLSRTQAATASSDVLLLGSTPDNGGAIPGGGSGVNQAAYNALADTVARTFTPALNVGTWDGLAPMQSWANVVALDAASVAVGATALDWKGDGVHLGWRTQAYRAALFVRDIGLWGMFRDKVAAHLGGFDRLAVGVSPGAPLAVVEGDNFDLDAYLRLKRWLVITDAAGTTPFMRIDPTSGTSFLPEGVRIGTTTGPRLVHLSNDVAGINLGGSDAPADWRVRSLSAAPVTLTGSGDIDLDLDLGSVFLVTLTGNVTKWAFLHPGQSGQAIEVHFIQDGTGGRTIPTSGYGAGLGSINLRSGFSPSSGANGRTVIPLRQFGGGYYQVAAESAI